MTDQSTAEMTEQLMAQLMANMKRDVDEEMKAESRDPMMDTLTNTWNERFDQHKLKYIIDHLEEYKAKIISVGHDFKKDDEKWKQQHIQLTRYLEASKNGVVAVKYHQTTPEYGRMFANRSQSLQNITRAVRHTIAGGLYLDIDIENAHPVILEHLCKQRMIDTPVLTLINKNREAALEMVMKPTGMSRGDAKQLFLAIMNGGTRDYKKLANPPDVVKLFYGECHSIWKQLIALDPKRFEECKAARIKAGKDYNHDGSFANKMLCDFENRILAVMVNYMKSVGLVTDTCALCFDGVMIPKSDLWRPEVHLAECQAAVKRALGIDIVLKEKPMVEGLELPASIPQYAEPRLEYFADHNQFAGKEVSEKRLQEWMDNALVYITGGGNGSMCTKNIKIDPHTRQPVLYFESVNVGALMDTLRINIRVPNPNYDPAAAREVADLREAGKRVSRELAEKAEKYDPDLKTLSQFVDRQRADRRIKHNNGIDFFPYLKRQYPAGAPELGDLFNMFTGLPWDGVPWNKPQAFEQSRFFAHLRNQMFPGDEGELFNFLKFAADMVQQPGKLRPVGHVFFSGQGCGKGMIVEWLKSVLGRTHVCTFNSTSSFFQRFNTDRMNKILYVLEELSERGEAFSQHNQLKAEMAAPESRFEVKGGLIHHIRNFARYIFNSNNENTLYVENDDRRFTMHRCSSQMANNRDYFKPIWEEVNSPEFAQMSFEYLANLPYDEADVMQTYSTSYKREQQMANLPSPLKFLIECIETKWEGFRRDDGRVSSSQMFERYGMWCNENRLKTTFSQPAFLAQLKKVGLEPRPLLLIGQRVRCLEINDEVTTERIRTYLRNPDLKLDAAPGEDAK